MTCTSLLWGMVCAAPLNVWRDTAGWLSHGRNMRVYSVARVDMAERLLLHVFAHDFVSTQVAEVSLKAGN